MDILSSNYNNGLIVHIGEAESSVICFIDGRPILKTLKSTIKIYFIPFDDRNIFILYTQ